ncbi:transcriptional regulator NadR [Sphaerisporangium krabiense]|uniref:NadR type nicotinamide-nucleotide adenylyltransferase n=1 Tax=Sphaerisporangium krabiense TaxID=763782 RepID=A0A7W8ZBL2_9ACTN|nr:AAA family ATPase [Sphaerisporangium krabiense]MBB5630688.1 NadR type nicotinamide-nucleotide adenylyltransferase [Sphaerisporangium krabiense]GII67445.1 transcriptional regulator NadR [Sphaerisporangium krabiense]
MRHRHGLVVGKFYPPHAGHHHLIDTAAAACERLTVVAAGSSVESIPIALRAAWLRERHPQPDVEIVPVVDDAEIDLHSDAVWEEHVSAFRAGLALLSGDGAGMRELPAVDAVFSSEDYGAELARRLSAVHVPVDPRRLRHPVSGTAVRLDPVACWQWLSPPVRAHLARRVVVVGAESTGTTTLARALAAHYAGRGGVWAATRWVPEYGRLYCEEKVAAARRADRGRDLWIGDLAWSPEEFTLIAERHLALEDAAARAGSPLLICDTDAFATCLWHERYLGAPAPDVERVHARARHDLWILTDPEGVPFHQDGWRDGERVRRHMSGRFREELDRRALPHIVVAGSHEHRLARAVDAVDALLAEGWTFTDPL